MASQRKSSQQDPVAPPPVRPSFVREARITWDAPPAQQKTFNSPAAVALYIGEIGVGGDPREHALVLALDIRNAIISHYVLSIGSVDQALVHPREVFRFAILAGATSIVFAHTHPSGSPDPSAEDVHLTRRLAQAGSLIGVPVLDSFIYAAGGAWWSARERAPELIR